MIILRWLRCDVVSRWQTIRYHKLECFKFSMSTVSTATTRFIDKNVTFETAANPILAPSMETHFLLFCENQHFFLFFIHFSRFSI